MGLMVKSLDVATLVGAGAVASFDVPKSKFAMQVDVTGSPTSVVVVLEGTIDGVNFFSLKTWASGDPVSDINVHVATAIRANLTTLSGGASPTVTAWVAAA